MDMALKQFDFAEAIATHAFVASIYSLAQLAPLVFRHPAMPGVSFALENKIQGGLLKLEYLTVPHRTQPHRTAPYRTLPDRTVPNRTLPAKYALPYRTVPNLITPDLTKLDLTEPYRTEPYPQPQI